MDKDPDEPGEEPALAIPTLATLDRREEGPVQQVLGVVRVARQMARDAMQGRGDGIEELAESEGITRAAEAVEQRVFVGSSHRAPLAPKPPALRLARKHSPTPAAHLSRRSVGPV